MRLDNVERENDRRGIKRSGDMNYLKDLAFRKKGYNPIRISGIQALLKSMYTEIKKTKGRGISRLYMRYFGIGRRTMYGYLSGKSPIPIYQFFKFVDLFKTVCNKSEKEISEIIDAAFKKIKYFSVASGKRVKLPKKMNADLAYLVGYTMGDGCLTSPRKPQRSVFRIRIASNTKLFLKKIINPIFKRYFAIEGRIYKLSNSKCFELSIQSAVIYFFMNKIFKIPIGDKKGKLKIPPIIKENSPNIKKAFIAGFFDADGCIYEKQNLITFSQADKKILSEIIQLLEDLGIKSRKISKTIKELGITYDFSIRSNSVYKFVKIIPLRHKNRIKRSKLLHFEKF